MKVRKITMIPWNECQKSTMIPRTECQKSTIIPRINCQKSTMISASHPRPGTKNIMTRGDFQNISRMIPANVIMKNIGFHLSEFNLVKINY